MKFGDVIKLGEELYAAEKMAYTVDPPSERHVGMAVADAYAVQGEYIRLRKERDGAVLIGMKVGATSLAIQEYFGISQPDFGVLLEDMEVSGGAVSLDPLIQPRIEPELAFVLDRPLEGPGVTIDDVLCATRGVTPAVEIIDSRIYDWRISLSDTIADNGSSALFVRGNATPISEIGDLRTTVVSFSRNEETALTAPGSAVLGDPANAVAWLANRLGELGTQLEAGHVVLSGSFTAALDCNVGDSFRADFGEVLGNVEVRVTR